MHIKEAYATPTSQRMRQLLGKVRHHPRTGTLVRHLKAAARFWLPAGIVQHYGRHQQFQAVQQAATFEAQFLLPMRSLTDLFPGIEQQQIEVPATFAQPRHLWASPLAELLHLAAICRFLQPRRIFEIGTFTGMATLIMALNTPADTQIWTLDLDPAVIAASPGFPAFTPGEVFHGTPAARKIQQLVGDTRTFDYTPYSGQMDLVFIDAVHLYAYVAQDTANAMRMLASGGTLVWDDYRWSAAAPECAGVTQCVHEFHTQHRPCVQLAGTRLALSLSQARS